ncbi:hypothetical protein COCOBI_05-0800 [Coccomyxa sp. Obi]|nr:hypothetical protein COCOBI_05-0800 [Coccomyxa sp. Obi]
MVKKTLVIAVDNSKECRKALDFALENFPTGYTYHLVHIQPRPPSLASYMVANAAAAAFVYENLGSLEQEQIDATNKFMHEVFVPKAQSAGANAFAVIVQTDCDSSSHIGAAICECAKKIRADALVMMRQNRSAVARFFMGSITRYCALHSPTPVLVVPTSFEELKILVHDDADDPLS